MQSYFEKNSSQRVYWALSYAQGYFHLGMLDEARSILNNLGSECQFLPNLMTLYGLILISKKNWPEALAYAKIGIERHSQIPDFYIQAAYCLEQMMMPREALQFWLQVPDTVRVSPLYHYHVAYCQASLGEKKAAYQYLRTAILLDPKIVNIVERNPVLKDFLVSI